MEKIDGMTCLMERKEIVDFMLNHPCVRLDWRKKKYGYVEGNFSIEGDLVALSVPSKSHPDLKVYGHIHYFSDTGKYEVLCGGSCIKASFGVEDVNTIVDRKNAPVIKEGDEIALVEIFETGARIRVMKATRLTAHSYPECTFVDPE